LNGCGKSGLALHLVGSKNFKFLSDNYSVVDASCGMVVPFPEPIRISSAQVPLARNHFAGDVRAFGKIQMVPKGASLSPAVPVKCLVLVRLGEEFEVQRISAMDFAVRCEALHQYLAETPEYTWPQMYFNLTRGVDLGQIARQARRAVCEDVPCYEMQLPFSSHLEARYARATEWISNALS
jgi:hypothetical protein